MSKNKMKKINIILFAFAALTLFFAASANAAVAPGEGPYDGWKCTAANDYTCAYSDSWPTPSGLYADQASCVASPSCLPVTTLTIDPGTVNVGENVLVSWSASRGAVVCHGTPDGSFPYTLSTPGSSPWSWASPGIHWVDMYCSNANGDGPSVRTTVNVVQPPSAACSISANPSSGILSQSNPSVSGTLSWTGNNSPTSCSINASCSGDYGSGVCDNSPGPVSPPAGGSTSFSTQLSTTYTMTCSNAGGSGTCSTVVDVAGMPPTINVSANPSSGTTGVFGIISYGLTSNDPRLNANDYTCTKFASPSTPGWGSGQPIPLSGSGVSASGSASYPALSQDTTFGIACRDPYGGFAGSAQTTVTVQPSQNMHYGCDPNNNSCIMVAGSGPDRCEPTHLCGTGSLTITPTNSSVGVGGSLVYHAWYTNGSVSMPVGAGANIDSNNFSVIKRTSETDDSATLTSLAAGTAQVSGEFQGLTAFTPVTVSAVSHNVQLTIVPNTFGWQDENAVASVTGGKPNSTAELSRIAEEYDLYPTIARSFSHLNPEWMGTDAAGNGSRQTPHSCADDGSGIPVKGYRQEVDTRASFSGWGQSNALVAIKDCRGSVRVTYKNGYPANWTMSGPTPADSATVTTVNSVAPGDNQSGSSGSDYFVSYKATDGQYTISGYEPCVLSGPASQTIGPGGTADFILSCSSGSSHLECLGSSCVRVRGAGSNLDGCNNAGQTCGGGGNHLACVGSSCTVLPGGGANENGCTGVDQSCSGGYHLGCVGNSCAILDGGGANQDGCGSVGESCSGGSHLACANNSCALVDGGGSNEDGCVDEGGLCVSAEYVCTGSLPANSLYCSGDTSGLTVDTPTTLVSACTPQVKCEARCGSGYVKNGNACVPASCPSGQTSPHNGCVAGVCTAIPGCGVTDCSSCSTPPGGGTHKECVNNSCANVTGAGSDRCSVSADCGGVGGGDPFHAACDPTTQSCVNVAGAGSNLCTSDSGCGGAGVMHLECQNNACLIVGGPGENQCTTIGQGCVAPTSCTMSANPKIISKGSSSTLTWSCDAGVTGCVLYDTTSGIKVSLGSVPSSCPAVSSCGAIQKVTPAKTGQYILECLKGGIKTIANVGVTVTSIIECNPIDPTCKQ